MVSRDPSQVAAQHAPDGGANLRELIAIMDRRRRGIALSGLVFLACGLAYVLVTPKTYTSTVSILVDGRARTPLGTELTSVNNSSPDAALIESQVRLIASDAILRRVVERERLADDPAYGPAEPGLLAKLMGAAGSAAGGTEDRAARALASLRRNVVVKRSERTYVMDVDVTAADGATAARLGNAVASAYVADQLDAKAQSARRDGELLNVRLADLQRRLSEAEGRVAAYKARNQIFDANGKRINEQELADGTTALSSARGKTADAKARLDQIQRIIASGRAADTVSEALKSPAIDRLRGQFTDIARQEANFRTTLGPLHPALIETQNQAREVKALIAEELKRIAAAAANDYQAARDNEANIERQVGGLKKSANVTSQASIELRELEHDVDASKAVYDKFLRARETVGETGLDGPAARVIAPATIPLSPSAPRTLPILGLSLASGLFMGTGFAFFREYLEQGGPRPLPLSAPPKQPAQPVPARARAVRWRWPGWPKSGRMAKAPTDPATGKTGQPQTTAAEDAAADGAIRSLWAELQAEAMAARKDTPFTILVTSTEWPSGKTAAAVDLARAAAGSGEKVLLMDADSVSPVLAGHVDPAATPQLIDLMGTLRPCYQLAGGASTPIHLVTIDDAEAKVVARLLRQKGPAPLDGINGNFTCVIMDGGTIGEDDDGAAIASAATRIVLVTRRPRLSRDQITQAMQALECPDEKFGGAVCNAQGAQAAA